MSEPTIEWRDGLAEFLPPAKKTQAIIRDVLGQYVWSSDADELTAAIMQALTKETS